ncbi:MAG: histidine kinase, partial [Nitrospirales bacterium]|nr:histidine kinase [Nitrospirales bacterium]
DNGKGIEAETLAHSRSLGILGMRERVAVLGGEVSIIGTKGQGTAVFVSLPLSRCAA